MEMQTICPWCESHIIWDEELGPEKHCPHCENEISGYRTVELDATLDGEELDYEGQANEDWNDDDDQGILRSTREIAANSTIQSMLNEQYEMPECTNCREYMLEVGEQTVGASGEFKVKHAPESGQPVVRQQMKVTWYVCPSCHRTDSYLSFEYRKQMLDALASEE